MSLVPIQYGLPTTKFGKWWTALNYSIYRFFNDGEYFFARDRKILDELFDDVDLVRRYALYQKLPYFDEETYDELENLETRKRWFSSYDDPKLAHQEDHLDDDLDYDSDDDSNDDGKGENLRSIERAERRERLDQLRQERDDIRGHALITLKDMLVETPTEKDPIVRQLYLDLYCGTFGNVRPRYRTENNQLVDTRLDCPKGVSKSPTRSQGLSRKTVPRCQAMTAKGTQCKNAAGPSGYCHLHEPK